MKKLLSVIIGLSMVLGATALTFAQEKKGEEKKEEGKKKKKKKKSEDAPKG